MMLQLALEAGGAMSLSAVLVGLDGLRAPGGATARQMFLGGLQLGPGGDNVGYRPVAAQWQCDEAECRSVALSLPPSSSAAATSNDRGEEEGGEGEGEEESGTLELVLEGVCEEGSVRNVVFASDEDEDAEGAEGSREASGDFLQCVPCMAADADWTARILAREAASAQNAAWLRASCEAWRKPVLIGALQVCFISSRCVLRCIVLYARRF